MCSRCLLVSLLILGVSTVGLCQQQVLTNPTSAQGHPDDQVVLTVGHEKMTASDVDRMLQAMPPQYRDFYGGPGKSQLPQYIIQMRILAAEAAKHSLAEKPEVQEAIKIATGSILANAERQRIGESIAVSDQELQDLYDRRKAEFKEVRLRHILLRTDKSVLAPAAAPSRPALPEQKARKKLEELRTQIGGGADFAEVARNYSEDLSTAGSGGDMGYVNQQTALPPLLTAAEGLSPGQVSEIITSPYGLEIIKVEDKRTKPLSEVKPQLLDQIRQGKVQEVVSHLTDQYHVEVDPQYFGAQKKVLSPPPPSSTPQN